MAATALRTFGSARNFLSRFLDLFRGPTFLMTFARVDPRFRETILLTVTTANNCYG